MASADVFAFMLTADRRTVKRVTRYAVNVGRFGECGFGIGISAVNVGRFGECGSGIGISERATGATPGLEFWVRTAAAFSESALDNAITTTGNLKFFMAASICEISNFTATISCPITQ